MPMLTAAADKGLSWIEDHRDEFSPLRGRDPWEQTMLLKPFSELMLTVTLLGRDPILRRRLEPIVSWAWREAGCGSMLIDLTSAKAELVEALGLYADFTANGYHNIQLETWFTYLVNTDVAHGLELTPWREVAFQYNLERLGLAGAPVLPVGSWLGARPEPWTISITTGYPMTHEVFYLTDFGARPMNLADDLREYLQTWLPAWQQIFRNPEHLDLLSELVMTAACIHSDPGLEVSQLLAERQSDDGSVAGPRGAGHDLPSPTGDLSRRRFLTDYHTTLVSVLALTYDRWNQSRAAVHTAYDQTYEIGVIDE